MSVNVFHAHLKNVSVLIKKANTRKEIISLAGAEINNLIRDIYCLEKDGVARRGAGNYYRNLFRRVLRLRNRNTMSDMNDLMEQVKLL
jgi:hypothetical protein